MLGEDRVYSAREREYRSPSYLGERGPKDLFSLT